MLNENEDALQLHTTLTAATLLQELSTDVTVLDVGWDLTQRADGAPLPCAVIEEDGVAIFVHFDADGRVHRRRVEAGSVVGAPGSRCAQAQGWMFGASGPAAVVRPVLRQLWRQGDVALSPYPLHCGLRSPFTPLLTLRERGLGEAVQLSGSHWLEGARLVFCDGDEVMVATDPVVVDREGRHGRLELVGTFRVHRARTARRGRRRLLRCA
ncbi:MAG: hypothetical protein ACI8S6_003324 [Myxococcota bacterium]|jgi:hypothetical protein